MASSTFLAAFCVTLSLILAHCSSAAVPQQISDHLHLQQVLDRRSSLKYSARRNLKLEEHPMNLKSLAGKEEVSHKKYMLEVFSGQQMNKVHKKQENVMRTHARRGTWREWIEEPDKSEYFTMDYHWVRRRRPIHNMEIPFVP